MFFDLNVCADGVKDQSRREALAMLMQMGYTSIAASHTVSGMMQESDRCAIRPLKLDALLAASPGLAETAKFHRKLLGVPDKVPFRQYSRITVVLDDQVQASALNPANPVLHSYDIVAVQPTNQKMLAQACSQLEVDLISFNMSQKLQFRIKPPFIKTALERGVLFEISYGPALSDTKPRKELFANAQMLVAATRGRNIVLSSGAKRALEIRGPNDVANMSTLFGLTMQQAKAAVSENSKSVLLRGFARKNTYKVAIAIRPISRCESKAPEKSLFEVPSTWEPLSTAEQESLPESDDNRNSVDMSVLVDSASTKHDSSQQTVLPKSKKRKRKKADRQGGK